MGLTVDHRHHIRSHLKQDMVLMNDRFGCQCQLTGLKALVRFSIKIYQRTSAVNHHQHIRLKGASKWPQFCHLVLYGEYFYVVFTYLCP